MKEELSDYLEKEVIIDTKSSFIFIGVLKSVGEHLLEIENVDVHDHDDFTNTKEVYAMETAKYGTKVNRRGTRVFLREIISISLLEDVIQY